jgi:hypothetical protein
MAISLPNSRTAETAAFKIFSCSARSARRSQPVATVSIVRSEVTAPCYFRRLLGGSEGAGHAVCAMSPKVRFFDAKISAPLPQSTPYQRRVPCRFQTARRKPARYYSTTTAQHRTSLWQPLGRVETRPSKTVALHVLDGAIRRWRRSD